MEYKCLLGFFLVISLIFQSVRAQSDTDQDDQGETCGLDEVQVSCPMNCPADYCPTSAQQDQSCPDQACNENATDCKCRFNYRRDKSGKCIPTRDCPPFDCSAYPNEEYVACPPLCPTDSCADVGNNRTCRFRIGVILICNPRCRCKKGFARNDNSVCVRTDFCPETENKLL